MNWARNVRMLNGLNAPVSRCLLAATHTVRPPFYAQKPTQLEWLSTKQAAQGCVGHRFFSVSRYAAIPPKDTHEQAQEVPAQKKPFSIRPYMELMRLDRPIGSQLLFWPCGMLIRHSYI